MTQLFLAHLLVLLVLASRPCFCLVVGVSIGLLVGIAIGKAESTGSEVAIGFSGCSLLKVLISF